MDSITGIPMENKVNIFAVYISEEPDGTVIAKAEIVGKPTTALDIGVEIMDGLKRLEFESSGEFKVQRYMTSSPSTH